MWIYMECIVLDINALYMYCKAFAEFLWASKSLIIINTEQYSITHCHDHFIVLLWCQQTCLIIWCFSVLYQQLANSALLSTSPAHSHHASHVTPSHSHSTQYYSLDASLGSDLSFLLNQTVLLSSDQLLAIAENLSPSQPQEVGLSPRQHNRTYSSLLLFIDSLPTLLTNFYLYMYTYTYMYMYMYMYDVYTCTCMISNYSSN